MKVVAKILKISLIIILILFLLSFFQAYHPLFDSFSHFRYHILIAIILLLGLLVVFDKKRVIFGILLLISIIYLYIFPFTYKAIYISKGGSGIHFSHMQFNLNFRNNKLDRVLELLSSKKPDIVTLQEVTNAHRAKLESLKKDNLYPYQRYCDFYPIVGAVAILSRYPISNTTCAKGRGLLSTTLDINSTKVNVVAIHLHWPYPFSQYEQVNELKPILRSLKDAQYSLISGDFNAAPWSNIVKKIAKESNTDIVGGLRWTISVDMQLYSIPFSIKLPIDQLLLHGINIYSIEVLEHFGSDHYPVFSRLYIAK